MSGLDYRKYDVCPDSQDFTSLRDDPCYLDCQAKTVQKPLKYMINNFHNRGCNPRELCFPGYLPQDGEGWAQCDMDNDSDLRFAKLTNAGYPQQMPALPVPTVPFMGSGCLDSDTEMKLRGLDTFADKSCQPKDSAFHNRRFDFFDHLCYNPNAVKNTIWNGYQIGSDTRQQRVGGYQNCNSRNTRGNPTNITGNPESRFDSSQFQGNYGNSGYDSSMPDISGFAPAGSCSALL